MKTLKEAYEALKADFPPEAYSEDSSRGFALTSLKAQYIVERLNDVFGVGGWLHNGSYKENSNGVLFFGLLTANIGEESVTVENVGFKAWPKGNNDGDAYKSAKTDSLSKCASYVGVGNEMYKGLIKVSETEEAPKERKSSSTRSSARRSSKRNEEAEYERKGEQEGDPDYEDQKEEPKLKTSRRLKTGTRSRLSSGTRANS